MRRLVAAIATVALLAAIMPAAASATTVPMQTGASMAVIAPMATISIPTACRNKPGKTICASKASRTIIALYNGKVVAASLNYNRRVRFGGIASDGSGPWYTREGTFRVYDKYLKRFSTEYHVWMPYFMRFSGGQGIHYSSEFANTGYAYSHGCIGTRSYSFARWLYNWAPLGTRVIVTRG